MSQTNHPPVAGVDGCRGGWVVATRHAVRVVGQLALVMATRDLAVIGVDMPIGLPDRWERTTDTAARRYLGRRSSTVFPTPPRDLLDAPSYAAANELSKQRFQRGLPRQSFNLFPKIREVDRLARAEHGDRLVEIHPECAFVAMGGGVALPPKRTAAGAAARLDLLAGHFGPIVAARPPGAGPDDVLDAFAVLWSAERFARGAHLVQGAVEHDRFGLPMRIVT